MLKLIQSTDRWLSGSRERKSGPDSPLPQKPGLSLVGAEAAFVDVRFRKPRAIRLAGGRVYPLIAAAGDAEEKQRGHPRKVFKSLNK